MTLDCSKPTPCASPHASAASCLISEKLRAKSPKQKSHPLYLRHRTLTPETVLIEGILNDSWRDLICGCTSTLPSPRKNLRPKIRCENLSFIDLLCASLHDNYLSSHFALAFHSMNQVLFRYSSYHHFCYQPQKLLYKLLQL